MPMTREEIYAKVLETLVDALGVEEDEVTEDARLMEELGA
ncbi:MAG: acyl carrier protein, partial [Planctomycetes bacterium]|nr:acyl carrier protein [Planctomycetota bacterium]